MRAMNLVGYDAMAVGNHEFDFGLAAPREVAPQARFPWLAANVTEADGAPPFAQYAVLEAGGVRVGVLGFVTPHVPNWESPAPDRGPAGSATRSRRPAGSSRSCAARSAATSSSILTHQGFERDPATGDERGDRGENQAYALATEVPGVDFVLAGHAHVVVAPRQHRETWVSEPGRWGNTLTRLRRDAREGRRGAGRSRASRAATCT